MKITVIANDWCVDDCSTCEIEKIKHYDQDHKECWVEFKCKNAELCNKLIEFAEVLGVEVAKNLADQEKGTMEENKK